MAHISDFESARLASGMTVKDAAVAAGLAEVTYLQNRKKTPEEFRLKELRGMYAQMSETARPILLNAVTSFLCK